MHVFSILLSLAPVALAQTTTTQEPVSEFLADLYGLAVPTAATGAVATSLASALSSYEKVLTDDAAYSDAQSAIYYAIATLSNSNEIFSSLATMGPLDPAFTTQSWYTANVATSAQSELNSVINGFLSVQTSVLKGAVATDTSSVTATITSSPTTSTGTVSSSSSSTTSVSKAGAQGARVTQMAAAGFAAAVAAGAAVIY